MGDLRWPSQNMGPNFGAENMVLRSCPPEIVSRAIRVDSFHFQFLNACAILLLATLLLTAKKCFWLCTCDKWEHLSGKLDMKKGL